MYRPVKHSHLPRHQIGHGQKDHEQGHQPGHVQFFTQFGERGKVHRPRIEEYEFEIEGDK